MKRSDIVDTLRSVKLSRDIQAQQTHLLLGIFRLLYTIADRLGCVYDDDEEEDEE